jgi:MFS family permease
MAMGFFAVFAVLGLGRFGYGAILPEMQARLGLTSAQAGSLASWNLVGYVLLAVIGGLLSTRYGARRIVSGGLVIAAVGMFITGLSTGVASASAARFLTGIGSGVVLVPSVALMSSWFPYHQRGLASGIVSSGSALGLVVSGPVVPLIVRAGGAGGGRIAWYVFAGIVFVLAVCNYLVMRDRPCSSTGAHPRSHESGRPLAWKRVVTSGYAWHLGIIYMLWAFAYMNYFVFFQKRLIADLDFSVQKAGTIYLILGGPACPAG